jgi:hypothetical protein
VGSETSHGFLVGTVVLFVLVAVATAGFLIYESWIGDLWRLSRPVVALAIPEVTLAFLAFAIYRQRRDSRPHLFAIGVILSALSFGYIVFLVGLMTLRIS